MPDAFDPFSPPVIASTPVAGAPAFAEWSKIVGPDETLVATGDQFSTFTGVDAGKDTRFVVFGQNDTSSATLDAAIDRLDGYTAAFTFDASSNPRP